MSRVPDRALEHLRGVAARPELPGRYVLHEEVGAGGMGSVWRATDTVLDREVAVKVLLPRLAGVEFEARLLREARILARLEHPGIVGIHDAGRLADGRAYYVMRLVRGRRLDEHAAALGTEGELLRVFLRACEAVAFANDAGIVHRDLKPANVMVGPFGEVLVLDWGVAKLVGTTDPSGMGDAGSSPPVGPDGQTAAGTVIGTPGFMAPEQAAGLTAALDARADVYGLGAMLRALLEGRPVPRPLRAVVARATAPSPDQRYPSAVALAADLTRYLDGQPVEAHREGPLEQLARFGRRHRVAILLIAGYIIMRLAVLAWRGI